MQKNNLIFMNTKYTEYRFLSWRYYICRFGKNYKFT